MQRNHCIPFFTAYPRTFLTRGEDWRMTSSPADPGAITDLFIPARYYNDPDIARLENERLWPRAWLCAARVEELPELGDYVAFEILDESILIVRTGAAEFTAYYNVCQHRARRLKDEPRGNVRSGFHCPFHGWRFGLDGGLRSVPFPADFPEGALKGVALARARVSEWAGWLWVTLSDETPDLRAYLGEVVDIVAPLRMETMRRAWRKTLIAPVNWKVVIGAFNEGYHAGATHQSRVDYQALAQPAVAYGDHSMYVSAPMAPTRLREADGSWRPAADLREDIRESSAHMFRTLKALVMEPGMRAADRLMTEVAPEASPQEIGEAFFRFQREETEKAGAEWPEGLTLEQVQACGTGWHIFPATIFLPTADGALWYQLRPADPEGTSCLFDIWALGRFAPGREPEVVDEVYDGFEAFAGQNPFLEEDFASMVAVDKGMRSRAWPGARLNPVQELQEAVFMRAHARYLGEGPGGRRE